MKKRLVGIFVSLLLSAVLLTIALVLHSPNDGQVMIVYPKEFSRIGFLTRNEGGIAWIKLPIGLNIVRFSRNGDEYAAVVKVVTGGESTCELERKDLTKVVRAVAYEAPPDLNE